MHETARMITSGDLRNSAKSRRVDFGSSCDPIPDNVYEKFHAKVLFVFFPFSFPVFVFAFLRGYVQSLKSVGKISTEIVLNTFPCYTLL